MPPECGPVAERTSLWSESETQDPLDFVWMLGYSEEWECTP